MGLCSGVKFDTLDFGYNDMTEFIVLCMWIKHLKHTVPLSHQGLKLWDGGYPQVHTIDKELAAETLPYKKDFTV